MLASAVIVFREILEAGLIVGVVLASARGVPRLGLWVARGLAAGAAGACLVAAFAGRLAGLFQGAGQELFDAVVLLVAVAMLAWHTAWMASHGRALAGEAHRLGAAVAAGERPRAALSLVCGVAMLREGSEIALFLWGVLVSGGASTAAILAGGAVGLLGGAAMAALVYLGLLSIPVRHLFAATSALVTLLAAGLAAQAVAFLQQAGLVQALGATLWDSSALLPEDGLPGRLLHSLVGYTDRPTGAQALAYLATVAALLALSRLSARRARRAARPRLAPPVQPGPAARDPQASARTHGP
jgi:high-affinity iron transporter